MILGFTDACGVVMSCTNSRSGWPICAAAHPSTGSGCSARCLGHPFSTFPRTGLATQIVNKDHVWVGWIVNKAFHVRPSEVRIGEIVEEHGGCIVN